MSRHPFGWHYPPGAANDPNAPYNQSDIGDCPICGSDLEDCQHTDDDIEDHYAALRDAEDAAYEQYYEDLKRGLL